MSFIGTSRGNLTNASPTPFARVECPSCALPALLSCLDTLQSQEQPLRLRLFYRFAKLSIALAPAINAIVGDVFKGRRLLIG
jgi:hypothetical protein